MQWREIKQGRRPKECRTSRTDDPNETHSWQTRCCDLAQWTSLTTASTKQNLITTVFVPCYTLLQHLSQYSATIWHVSTASQTHGKNDILFQSWEIFFVKGQRVYSLHTLGQMVSVATTQLCLCHRKAATDMQENEQWITTYRNRQWARFGLQVVVCQRLPYSPNS